MPVFNEDPDESEKNFGLQNTVGSLIGNVRAVLVPPPTTVH
jgi:hypothetical protein